MKMHLPNSAFLGNLDTFLASFSPDERNKLDITFNEKWVWVHPIAISMVASLGLEVKLTGGKIICSGLGAKSLNYLASMGLFKFLDAEEQVNVHKHEPAGRFIPIANIKNSEELKVFIENVGPLLHTTPNQAEPIKYIVSELVRNVFEHSSSKNGAIACAQFFKKSNRVSVGVADTGLGIKKTIMQSYSVQNDKDAIKLALTPGITGTTSKIGGTPSNAGAGLFFIKSIAKVNREFFLIYSGKSTYKLLKTEAKKKIALNADPYKDKHSVRDDLPYWQGTAVGVDISLEQTQNFKELLELIRNVYRLDIKEKAKARFKKAKFI